MQAVKNAKSNESIGEILGAAHKRFVGGAELSEDQLTFMRSRLADTFKRAEEFGVLGALWSAVEKHGTKAATSILDNFRDIAETLSGEQKTREAVVKFTGTVKKYRNDEGAKTAAFWIASAYAQKGSGIVEKVEGVFSDSKVVRAIESSKEKGSNSLSWRIGKEAMDMAKKHPERLSSGYMAEKVLENVL